jgi:hypothetical protein
MPVESQKKFSEILNTLSQENEELPVLLHDGMEREILRPVDSDEQKENYSGKKKKHTVKNTVIITACCLILFVTPSVCGKMHDKKIADTIYSFTKPCILYQYTGYQWFRPGGVVIEQPVKSPKEDSLLRKRRSTTRKLLLSG